MKEIVIIFLVFALIFSTMNIIILNPLSSNNSIAEPENSVATSIFNKAQEPEILDNLNKLDGYFTENHGQVANDLVKYYIQGKGVWFLDDGVVFEIREERQVESHESESPESEKPPYTNCHELEDLNREPRKSVVLKLNFEGCKKVTPIGRGLLTHRSNFFYGNDSTKWCTNVPNYQEILYENLYDNIDLRYYTSPKGLKYDFIVYPGGDPSDIRISYKGAEDLYIDSNEDLILHTLLGEIVDSELFIYQNINNNENKIEGTFKIYNSKTYGFEITGKYDSDNALIIDPLVYSTFIGGNAYDFSHSIAIDSNCNGYVTGGTVSTDFPNTTGAFNNTNSGLWDVFVFKLNPTGSSLLYSTYIGGSCNDSGPDVILKTDIKIDSTGNTYVTGTTNSSNFPTTPGAYDPTYNGGSYDVFMIKLNQTGSTLLYSTFVGGSSDDYGSDIVIDSSCNAYVTGWTNSPDFPNTTGAYDITHNNKSDVFVLKLNPSGSSLLYSTFIGGNDSEWGHDIAIDSNGNVYVTGMTESANFPKTAGVYDTSYNGIGDVFVLKLNPTGSSLLYSTFIGGSDCDRGFGIAIDTNGNTYVTGYTTSNDFPNTTSGYNTTWNGWETVYVLKLNPTGSSLIYSIIIGGSNRDYGMGITIDSSSNAYVAGWTDSIDFPTTPGAYDNSTNAPGDVFVFKLDPTGALLLNSTFVSGSITDSGYDIGIDSSRNVYVTGWTNSNDFPVTPKAFDTKYDWFGEAFIFKLNFTSSFPPSVIDLNISKPEITRTNTVYLYSNATDIEDSEHNLTPHLEYRVPNELVWNDTYFSNPHYNNSRWEVSFTPAKDAVLGLYDFRVCFNDTDMLFSNWFYLNDSLMVLNHFPIIIDSLLSRNTAIKIQNLSIWLNGSDVEDEEQNLSAILQYREPKMFIWNTTYLKPPNYVLDKWEINFSIPFGAPFGYYDFRARVQDRDGNYSQWAYMNDSLLIYNLNPDVIDIELSKNIIYRTESVDLFVNGTDYETPESILKFICQYKSDLECNWQNITGSYITNRWQSSFTPSKDAALGLYDFRTRFKDINNGISNWLYLNDSLLVLNNKPLVVNLILSQNIAILGDVISICINGSDVEEPEENLTIELEYKDPNTQFWDTIYLNNPKYFTDRWEFTFNMPFDASFGYYDFRARFYDYDGDYSQWLYTNDSLLVYNIEPKVIDLELSKSSVYRTDSVSLYVNGTDHETPESMLIFYVQYRLKKDNDWIVLTGEYSNSNTNWKAKFVTTIESILGHYDFRVKFEDNESASSGWIYLNDSLEVLNNIPIIENINSSEPFVFRTDSVIIYTNAIDIENSENLLTCELQYKSPSGIWNDLDDEAFKSEHWEVIFTPPIDAELGSYDLSVNFKDLDEDYSGWTLIQEAIEVKNNLPMISELCDDFEVNIYPKDIDLTQYSSDIEDSDEKLIWSIDQTTVDTTLYSASIIGISENIFHIIPKDNAIGSDDITLILTDKDGGSDTKSDITIYIDSIISTYYGVNISVSPAVIEIEQGESEKVTLTITNKGRYFDEYNLSFESDDFSITDIKFSKISLGLGEDDEEQITVTITIPEDKNTGEYQIKFIAEGDIASDNTILTINVKEKPDTDLHKPSSGIISNICIIIILIIIILIIICSIFIGGTEIGKYKFLSLVLVPLFNKFHTEKVLDNFIRGQIYGYIRAKPGEHYNAIKSALELNNGTFVHHVRILEKEKYIYSKRDGFHTRFYPKGIKVTPTNDIQLNEFQKNIVERIRERPGISQHEIVTLLGTSQQVVSYNLTKLARDNIIMIDKNGRENRYFINYDEQTSPQPQVPPSQPVQHPENSVTTSSANPTDISKNQQ